MSNERKPISKKVRFEVFKRDLFTCQYCGRSAPEVILNADHIKPVFTGGKTEIMNLITSCFDCNSGKGKRELSDQTVLIKQKKQVEELEERRQQIEMMMEWHGAIRKERESGSDYIIEYLNDLSPSELEEKDILTINKLLKKYSFKEVLYAIDNSVDYYKSKTKKNFAEEKAEVNRWNPKYIKELIEKKQSGPLAYHEEERLREFLDAKLFSEEAKEEDYFRDKFLSLFLKKLPGVLKIQKREKEDKEYPFIKEIYWKNKKEMQDFYFTWSIVEKYYKIFRAAGVSQKRCVQFMTDKSLKDVTIFKSRMEAAVESLEQ